MSTVIDMAVLSGSPTVSEEELGRIRSEAERWNAKSSEFFGDRMEWGEKRFCKWGNQSADGRHWDNQDAGIRAEPFSGASDQRLRWSDGVVIHKLSLLCVALNMAKVSVKAAGPDRDRGRRISLVLRAMVQGMGSRWLRSWIELLQYYLADSPGVALMGLEWVREEFLDARVLSVEEVEAAFVVRAQGMAEAAGVEFSEAEVIEARRDFTRLMNGEDDEPLLALLMEGGGYDMARGEARRALKDLRSEGETEIEVVRRGYEGPVLTPGRLGDDFLVPTGAQDFEDVAVWFVSEWVTGEELTERVESEGWDRKWVEGVLSDGGRAVIQDSWGVAEAKGFREGMHQVVWAYHRGASGKGVTGRYEVVFGNGEGTAFGRRLISGTRGKWPAVFFQRERLNSLMLDSRGVVEIIAPSEGMGKKLRDTAADNGVIGGLPPTLQKGRSLKNKFIKPLMKIAMRVNEDFQFMRPPEYPATANKVLEQIWEDVDWYFGVNRGKDDRQGVLTKLEVQWFLCQAWDVFNRLIALAQDNASDLWLSEVLNESGVSEGLTRADVIGAARVMLSLDVDDMDPELVIKKVEAVGQTLMMMDTSKILDTGPVVAHGMSVLFPDLAEESIRTVEAADRNEIEEEKRNLLLIRAGVMPEVNAEGGWNYEQRLSFYEALMQENPAVFDDLPEDKRMVLERWMQVLAHQAEQFGANRRIGRTGADGVAEE